MKTIKTVLIIFLFGFHFNAISQNWSQWGDGAFSTVTSLFTDTTTNTLYASGEFLSSSGDTIYGIAQWDGSNWDSVGFGVSTLGKMQNYNGNLCVFSGNNIYSWNGINWDIIGTNIINGINDLAVYHNDLYAISDFGYIAKWNGNIWTEMNPGWVMTRPRALIVYHDELYVAGEFESDSGNNILRWDGVNWKGLANGINFLDFPEFGQVAMELAVYNNELYVSSSFWKQDGNPDNCIARWDSTEWNYVGGGLNSRAVAFANYNNELYAAGGFTSAGGISVNGIAKWDGTKWCRFSNNTGINTMTVYNNELIVAGSFTEIDGFPLNRIAKWIGGNYVDTCGAIIGVNELTMGNEQLKVYPNPANSQLTIELAVGSKQKAAVIIYDVTGREVLKAQVLSSKFEVDVSGLMEGVYFIRIETDNGVVSKKFVKRNE